MAVKFSEGWQKKAGHEVIRNRGDSARKAADHAEKAARASAHVANKPARTQESTAAREPASTGKDASQASQGSKPASHDQSTRNAHAAKAAQQHVKVQEDARNLQTLSTRGTSHAGSDRLATREAVGAKLEPQSAQFAHQKTAEPRQPAVAQQAAQAQVGQAKKTHAAEQPSAKQAHKPAPKSAQKAGSESKAPAEQQDAKAAARPEAAAQNAAAAVVAQPGRHVESTGRTDADDVDADDDGLDEDRDHSTSAFSSGSRVGSTKRELGGLLGGFAGEGGESFGDGADPAVAAVEKNGAAEKLPEKDPAFHVYSEFDEANPGIEHVKARAQVLSRMVLKEQRLNEIAKLDQEIEGKIRDMFQASPLSKRLQGELAKELKAANFLSSVYGGLIG
jgi:hypothetical protein